MNRLPNGATLLACLGLLACSPSDEPTTQSATIANASTTAVDPAQEREMVEKLREERTARLTSETGWLTLVGLYWFEPGVNTFGSADGNSLRLEHAALSPEAGSFVLEGDSVRFVAAANSSVTHDGEAVTDMTLAPDFTGDPTILRSGSLVFYVIGRGDNNFGLRVRDTEHPLRKAFHGLDYFPYEESWVLDARFEPYEAGKTIPIINVLGMRGDIPAPGALVFEHDGQEFRLDALLEDPESDGLFVMFADQTSGRDTYGAGRFLYTPLPVDGTVQVNFNMAYNPPCAFNEFATRPLPPPQNRLAVRVEAGELKYDSPHLQP